MIAPCCWRSRIVVVRCSFAHRLATGGDVPQEKSVVVAASGVEAAMGAAALDQGLIAVNSILRDWVKGQITAIETGILRGCNRLLTVFHLGSTTMKAGQG